MKILSIIGARPQFIKASATSRALKDRQIVIHTGQHYDFNLSDIFFDEFKMKIDYNIGVGSATHREQTGKMLIEIEKVLLKEKPNIVLVYGDGNSAEKIVKILEKVGK